MPLYHRVPGRTPVTPVLVIALEGWIDAGLAAQGALSHLLAELHTELVARFDIEELIDLRARRPTLQLTDGVHEGLRWPEIQVRLGQDAEGNDVALLVGPEPDMRWRAFSAAVLELARELHVRLAVGLGGFPAAAPHTRPVRLASTATSRELAAGVGFVSGTIEVPAGISAALEEAFGDAGVPAVGLWARVPHYTSAMSFPAASEALVDGLCRVAGLSIDVGVLHRAADENRTKVDELIGQSAEHQEMVRLLESSVDAAEGNAMDLSQVPTGEEIADELERFLRDQRGG